MNNSIPKEGVDLLLELIKLTQDKHLSNRRTYSGRIKRSDSAHVLVLLSNLKSYINEQDRFYPNYDEEDYEIDIALPPFYNFSLSDMLTSYPELRTAVPDQIIYFEDIDYIYIPTDIHKIDDSVTSSVVKNYLKSVSLYNLLKTQADHSSRNATNDETIYFLGSKKISIFNNLTVNEKTCLNNLSAFEINYINSNIHKDAIKNIITDSLNSFYIDKEVSFNQICSDFDSIYDVIKNNYDVYISQFTFEKIKKEVEKFRTESITRINKAFSDIQMQIIAIPASLIVVASNLKTGNSFSFITNTIILLGALFFTIAVFIMCENQNDTLDNIKHEIDAQEKEFTKDPLFKDKNEINSNFIVMNTRFSKQKSNLKLVKRSIYASIVIMFLTYFYIHVDNTCLTTQIPKLENFYCTVAKK
jgi:hypothetical protein